MSQPELLGITLPVLAISVEAETIQRAVDNDRWSTWGRSIGLLTPEMIQQANHPDWQWGDYCI